jgi:kynurenine 3-monooxygenase
MPEMSTRSVLIIGAGPVGCALATLLRRQGLEVDVFERGSQSAGGDSGHSFNLTLTSRGLSCLPSSVERRLYRQGAVLTKRIIHHRDGAISTQPYGTTEAHHLLSIPRRVLQDLLRDQALREGARIHFERECLDVDTARPAALVCDRNGRATWVEGLLVVGCDGSHSVVRDAIAAACPGHMRVTRRLIAHGHAEITMEYDGADPTGMHLWPRGDHFLQAQPNRDSTFTTSLFKPLEAGTRRPRFSALASAEAISDYCATEFADVFGLMSQVATDLTARPPGMLQVIRCAPYNHRRAVLVGDAAHVVVPFFGQGINCSFEDAATLARLLEKLQFVTLNERGTAADIVTQEYSDVRVKAGHALAELSLDNLEELSNHVDSPAFLARRALERRLHEIHPQLYIPLYQLVAFTDVSYDEAQRVHHKLSEVLDSLCEGRDLQHERDAIIDDFVMLRGDELTPRIVRAG